MNFYVRYFDTEYFATSFEDLCKFLASIEEIQLSPIMLDEVRSYVEGPSNYSRRFKTQGKNYFIIIKTSAQDIEEFRNLGTSTQEISNRKNEEKNRVQDLLNEQKVGWYDVSLQFRRVLQLPGKGKCQYVDTDFGARVKASSIQDSYNKVIDHLRNRADVDPRSQFPSIKGKNFRSICLGMNPQD
mgnify:CR=1 FL=1